MTSGSPRSAEPAELPGVPEPILAAIENHLRQREHRREELHQRARRLRRLAQLVMTHVHEGRPVAAEEAEMRQLTRELGAYLAEDAPGDEGLTRDAFQESAEASLLVAVVEGRALPGPVELSIEPEAYLLGLGDLVGEVRRLALARLAEGDVDGAEAYVRLMDGVFRELLRFDTTRAIVALKPKQDNARALVERTRGEVTMARVIAKPRRVGSTGAEVRE